MRCRVRKLFIKIWRHDPLLLEIFLGVEAIILGLTLLHPMNTFSTSVTYSFLSSVFGENIWGGIIVVYSLIYFTLISIPKKSCNIVGLFLILAFWGFVATGFYLGNYAGTGWPLQLGFVTGALWCILNLDGYR